MDQDEYKCQTRVILYGYMECGVFRFVSGSNGYMYDFSGERMN